MAVALASSLRDVLTDVTIDDVRAASHDCAIVSCTKVVRDRRAAADAEDGLPTIGVLTYVLTRTGAGWKIALAQTTPVVASWTQGAERDRQLEATVERALAGEDSYGALTEREQAIVRAAWDQRIAPDVPGLTRNGNEGIGKPEPLRYDVAGHWWRRITYERRLVYKTTEDEVRIAACRYRYGR